MTIVMYCYNTMAVMDMTARTALPRARTRDMIELDTARRDVVRLEAAPTRYVEGSRVRFAYRRPSPSTERGWFLGDGGEGRSHSARPRAKQVVPPPASGMSEQ
jgi:hypothetical protein